jgi:predicted RNase H-like HicB family nuclease
MNFRIETEQEDDGRWIADVRDIPGAMVYGATRAEAIAGVVALVAEILDERGESASLGGSKPEQA